MAERSEYLLQHEVATEIRLINEFLTDIDSQKRHMSYFVAGLQVAVESILAAVNVVINKHPRNSIQTSTQEKEAHTQSSPIMEDGEKSEDEEEQMEKTRMDEDPVESNLSNNLRKSLNSTLGDLEQVEEKLTEMDCHNHMAMAGQQPSGDSACYLDFMHEFLAMFRQKLSGSCKEFLCMESQEMALLQERKALKDLSFQLTNIPQKTAQPKVSSTGTAQKTNEEDNTPCVTESTKTNPSKDSIPFDKTAAQEDGDSKDMSSETRPATTQERKTEDTPSTDANATAKKGDTQNNIFPEPNDGPQQSDDKDASSSIKMTPPQDASASSTLQVTPEDQKYSIDQIIDDDDDFDYVSPVGMKRMFGTLSQESKIQFSPTSPINRMDSPTKTKINFEVSPAGGENES